MAHVLHSAAVPVPAGRHRAVARGDRGVGHGLGRVHLRDAAVGIAGTTRRAVDGLHHRLGARSRIAGGDDRAFGAESGSSCSRSTARRSPIAAPASTAGRTARRCPIAGAVAATVIAIAAALVAGPALPGARSDALLDYRKLGGADRGPGNLVVVTPLVDIRDRLKTSPAQELFTVDSHGYPTYWRIAGLDEFDGNVWGIAETQSAPIDTLEGARPRPAPR